MNNQNEIAIKVYKIGQTIPKTKSGGVAKGLCKFAYQEPIVEYALPKKAAA